MKKTFLFAAAICSLFVIVRCGQETKKPEPASAASDNKPDMANKGIGPIKEVKITYPLDEAMATQGQFIFKTKCFACHKLTAEKLVGPGWKGITDRRANEWIMNFVLNTNVMLDKDLVAQQLIVVCVTRMPNQNLTNEDARNVLEFMRKNDGKH